MQRCCHLGPKESNEMVAYIFSYIVSEQKTGLIYESFYALVNRFWNRNDKIRVRFVFHCNIHTLTKPCPAEYFQINSGHYRAKNPD